MLITAQDGHVEAQTVADIHVSVWLFPVKSHMTTVNP